MVLAIQALMAASYSAVRWKAARAQACRSSSVQSPRVSLARKPGYCPGSVSTVTAAWFLAEERSMLGPPMSICSMHSATVTPGLAMVASNGYRLTTTRSMGPIPRRAASATCSGTSRRNSRPPWMRGCRVLTRPPKASGAPVYSATSMTSTSADRRALSVPPVARMSQPSAFKPLARGSRPFLS